MKDLSPGQYSRKELPRYFALRPKALASRLGAESPAYAKIYAERIALVEQEMLGMPGRDQYAVRDIIRSYANKIDLEAHFDNADLYRGPQTVRYTKIKSSR